MKVLKYLLLVSVFVLAVGMSWLPAPPAPEPPPPTGEVGDVAIIFENGLFGSVANWDKLISFLEDNGYRKDFLFPVKVADNYSMCSIKQIEQLEDTIDSVRLTTGVDKVILIGHSRGGTLLTNFMHISPDAELVSDVITLDGANSYPCGSVYGAWPDNDPTPGDALYTSIYSDTFVSSMSPLGPEDSPVNIHVSGVNHMTFPSNQRVMELVVEAIESGGSNN